MYTKIYIMRSRDIICAQELVHNNIFIRYTDNEENQNSIKCPSTDMYRMSNV